VAGAWPPKLSPATPWPPRGAQRQASAARKSRSDAGAEAVARRLQALVRPRCAPDSQPACPDWPRRASGAISQDTRMAPPLRTRAMRWACPRHCPCDSRPLRTGATCRRRRATRGMGPRLLPTGALRGPRHSAPRCEHPTLCARGKPHRATAGPDPVCRCARDTRSAPPAHARLRTPRQCTLAPPNGLLTPGTDTTAAPGGAQTGDGTPHHVPPIAVRGTTTRRGHEATATRGPPHQATPAARAAGTTGRCPPARHEATCRAARTPVVQHRRPRGPPHGTDMPRGAYARGRGAPHTRPPCHRAPWSYETTDTARA